MQTYDFYITINSGNTDLDYEWEPHILKINTEYNLVIGDIINFSEHKSSEHLMKDYGTKIFVVIQRKLEFMNNDLCTHPLFLIVKPKID